MAITGYFHVIVIIFVAAFVNGIYLCSLTVEKNYYARYVLFSIELLYPILGWLVDAKIGRYKAIVYSMVLMSVGCVCLAVAWTAFYWYVPLYRNPAVFIVLVLCIAWIRANVTLFITAALPFITDQMIGASGDQLATAIDWYIWSTYSCIQTIIQWIPFSIPDKIYHSIFVLIVLISCALAVSCMLLCHHHLDKQPYITNPIRDIASVLNYARKNKCARNRSALTYWENKTPSRLDLGMEKYGGPFTEEQVEDVKTVLRLLLLIFCYKMTYLPSQLLQLYQLSRDNPYLNQMFGDIRGKFILFLVPAYYLLIKPLCSIQPIRRYCSKLKMSMLKIIGVGILLKTSSLLGYVILDLVSHDVTANGTCLQVVEANTPSYYSVLILGSLDGLGSTLQIVTIIKFIVAQTPNKMKGFVYTILLGLRIPIAFAGTGLYQLFHRKEFPQCGLYYHLTQFLIFCVVMVLYVVVSRWYRLRSRNNPINIHHIVETHVARNLDREQEYLREKDNSSFSYGTID